MSITGEQLEQYHQDGYLFLPQHFSPDEVEVMKAELPAIFADGGPERVVEKEGKSVRSIYGAHTRNEIFRRLSRHPRIVALAMKILGSEVYIYQFKINAKSAFVGDIWEWHQDYIYWLKEDGLPEPRAVNAFVFLDQVTEFNGPIFLIPGSHKKGVIEVPASDISALSEKSAANPYDDKPTWIYDLTAKLRYSIDQETVAQLVSQHGIVTHKGSSGSALLTHPNIVHASPNNISPFNRVTAVITYNSVENVPITEGNRRPEFLVSHNYEPIVAVADDALLRATRHDRLALHQESPKAGV